MATLVEKLGEGMKLANEVYSSKIEYTPSSPVSPPTPYSPPSPMSPSAPCSWDGN